MSNRIKDNALIRAVDKCPTERAWDATWTQLPFLSEEEEDEEQTELCLHT